MHQLPDSTLHPRLRNRLLDIAAHLARVNESSPTFKLTEAKDGASVEDQQVLQLMDSMRAAYLADLIIRSDPCFYYISLDKSNEKRITYE